MTFCPFSKYKDLFGSVNTGLHIYKFQALALVDYFLTILAAFATTYITDIPVVLTTIGWLILGIFVHMLFGVETNTLNYLGIKC